MTSTSKTIIRSATTVATAALALAAGVILHFADRDDASVQYTAGLCRRTGLMMLVTYRNDAGVEAHFDSAHDLARSVVRYGGKHNVAAATGRAGFTVAPWVPEVFVGVANYNLPPRGKGACARSGA